MKRKNPKQFILTHLLCLDQIATIHQDVSDFLKNKNHIEISFQGVDQVDASFLQWFISFIRSAKSRPYSVVICGEIPQILIRNWEFIGISTPFFDFLKENQVTITPEE